MQELQMKIERFQGHRQMLIAAVPEKLGSQSETWETDEIEQKGL
jgi:hypothetical protein